MYKTISWSNIDITSTGQFGIHHQGIRKLANEASIDEMADGINLYSDISASTDT